MALKDSTTVGPWNLVPFRELQQDDTESEESRDWAPEALRHVVMRLVDAYRVDASTSENALLYGHPLTGGNSYAIQTGVLIQAMHWRTAADGEPLPKVAPPVELPTPIFANFDHEVAHATHAYLSAGDMNARRLHRALDWYRIALSNAEAVTRDVRVGAAPSAIEALTGLSDETKR